MNLGILEEICLQKVLFDLHQDHELPMKLLFNNKTAIRIAYNPVQRNKTKHIEIDRHFVRRNLTMAVSVFRTFYQINKLLMFLLKVYLSRILSHVLAN